MRKLLVMGGFAYRQVWALLLGLMMVAHASAAGHKNALAYQAIEESSSITSEVTIDLDGDGSKEVAVAYKQNDSGATPEGGLLVLGRKAEGYRSVYHVFFDSTYISEMMAGDEGLVLIISRFSPGREEKLQLPWRYGKEFYFNADAQSPLAGISAKSSSHAKGAGAYADLVLDGDFDTAWAEGRPGTGVSESVTIKLKKPLGIGLVGIMPGKGTAPKVFKVANRIHRATLEIQTESDMGDEASALDFSDLGIDIGGDSIDLSFENKPVLTYFRVVRRQALNLELRINSVFLGDKEDDTYVAEIEVVPLVPRSESIDRGKPYRGGAKPSVKGAVINE